MENFTKNGFVIEPRNTRKQLSDEITRRYKTIPKSYLDFLNQFMVIANRQDNFWFNSIEIFNNESNQVFKWNDFELQSLEAFEDDKDEQINIKDFWDQNLPIAFSVIGEYQYLAICLNEDNYGEIVYGVEPEFEESEKVCDNFDQLSDLFADPSKSKYLNLMV